MSSSQSPRVYLAAKFYEASEIKPTEGVINNFIAVYPSEGNSPDSFNLSQSEQSFAQSAQKEQTGQWSCKLCHVTFNDTLKLVTHILKSCDQPLSTFSSRSAIRICMHLDQSGYFEMFKSYLRVASEDGDDEGSDHDSDMDTEGTYDTDSREYDSEATISDEEDVEMKEAGTEGVWWVEQEEEEEEEGKDLGSADENEEDPDPVNDQPTLAAQGTRVRPPRYQEFPAMPPHSLSAGKKTEWTFKRNRKYYHTPPTTRTGKKAPSNHHDWGPGRSAPS